MADKTYNIAFNASAKGLEDIVQQIKSLMNIDLKDAIIPKNVVVRFKELQSLVKGFVTTLNAEMAKPQPDPVMIKQLDTQFKGLSGKADALTRALASIALPPTLDKELKDVADKVKAITSTVSSYSGSIGSRVKMLDDKGSGTGLSPKETNKAFAEITKGPVSIKEFSITGYDDFIAKFEELRQAKKLSKEEEKEYTELIARSQEQFAKRVEVINAEIASFREKLPLQAKAKEAAMAEQQATVEKVKTSEEYTEREKKAADKVSAITIKNQDLRTKQAMAIRSANAAMDDGARATDNYTGSTDKNTKMLARATKQVFTYGTILAGLRKIYRETINTITEMDKALTGMAVVTTMSREQSWKLVGSFQNLARETGKTSSEIAAMATKFYQQGKTSQQVLKLTEAAAKAATIAGIDGAQSIDLLTNAMNGFHVSASQAMSVSDKFAALAAAAATDYEELATALSKVAAQANLAGMSMDFTLGMLTKGIEVTREAPETIGTALKTVISRMRELTDYGKTLEDGMNVNRVAAALDNIGVSLMDEDNQFRDLEVVITEVGKKWSILSKNQQANVAIALAGTRQQSRLIAMMQDFDRTLELVDISANSYGATLSQQAKYMEGLEASVTLLSNAWQELITNVTNSEVFINVINTLTGAIEFFASNTWLLVSAIGASIVALTIANILETRKHILTVAAVKTKENEVAINAAANALEKKGIITKLLACGVLKAQKKGIDEATKAQIKFNIAASANIYALIAIGIVAALGLIVWGITAAIKSQNDYNDSIEKTNEKLNKLQADLYNLNNASGSIEKLSNEFEELSNKIVKSTEDLKRLKEIAQSVNDTFGNTVVDESASFEEQARQIKVAKILKDDEARRKREEINNTLGKGFGKTVSIEQARDGHKTKYTSEDIKRIRNNNNFDTHEWGGQQKSDEYLDNIQFQLDKQKLDYAKSITQSITGKNAIRSLGVANIKGLDNVSSEVKDTILEMLVADFGNVLTDKGIDFNKFANTVNEDFIKSLDKVYSSEKLSEYKTFYDKLKPEQQALLDQTMPIFKAFDKIGLRTAQAFDSLDLKKEEVNAIWSSLTAIDVDGAADAFASLMKDIENMSGDSAEKKRKLYKKLITEQQDFAMKADKVVAMSKEELQAEVNKGEEGDKDAQAYNAALLRKGAADEAFKTASDALAGSKEKSGKKYDALKATYDAAALEKNNANEAVEVYTKAWDHVNESKRKLGEALLNLQGFSFMAESVTKLTSTMERLNKISDLTTLSVSEQAEILKDYPELLDSMSNGYLSASDSMKLYKKNYDKIQEELLSVMASTQTKGETDFKTTELGLDIVWGTDDKAKKARQKIIDENMTADSDLVKQFQTKFGLDDEKAIMKAKEFQQLMKEMGSTQYLYDQNAAKGISGLIDGDTLKLLESAKDKYFKLTNAIAEYNTQLSRLDKDSQEYKKILLERNQALMGSIAAIQNEIKDLDTEANKILGESLFDNKGAERSIKDVVKYVNGIAIIDNKLYDELSATSKELVNIAFKNLNDLAKTDAELTKNLYENRVALAQSYIDIQTKETQDIIDNLEKRKTLYEKYFDELDALQDEQDKKINREALLKQISALSGAVDSTSKSKLKDLQKQLNDLNKEDLKAQTEEQRNALLENLDTEIEEQNKYLDTINDSLNKIVAALSNPESNKQLVANILNKLGISASEEEIKKLMGYSNGGLVKQTGPVMVHGTSSKPEAFLDSYDTRNIQDLLDTLRGIRLNNIGMMESFDNEQVSNISIGNINIHTEQLNNEQDFAKAGNTFASEFAKAIAKRGININVKK